MLKYFSWIVCPIIMYDGINCSGAVIGVCGSICAFENLWE